MKPSFPLAFHRYQPAAWLRVTGSDAATFLQGQFTQDLQGLKAGRAAYGLWLTPKGKTIADSFILKGVAADEFWILSYFCSAETIRRRLEDFIVADEVSVAEELAPWMAVALLGEGAGGWLRGAPRGGFVFRGRRTEGESWEWIFPAAGAGAEGALPAGAVELSAVDMERERIEAVIPAVPRDIGPDDLPNEGRLEAPGISYAKGCYLGQEIMARLRTRGQLRRRLIRVRGSGVPPPLPAALWQEGRAVGALRSAAPGASGADFTGLALLTLAGLRRDEPLALSPDGPPAIAPAGFSI